MKKDEISIFTIRQPIFGFDLVFFVSWNINKMSRRLFNAKYILPEE